jgi:4-carboxymuconolactone decarboxylase
MLETRPFLPEPSGHRDVALGLCRVSGRVLLVRNARRVGGATAPVWDLPGGEAHPGEPVRDAVAREWEEEVGFRAEVGDLLLVVDGAKRRAPDAAPVYTWRTFVFEVAPPPFGAMPVAGEEIEKVEVVPVADAIARLTAPYHAPLRALLGGAPARHAQVSWVDPASLDGPDRGAAGLRRLLVVAAAAAVGDLALVRSECAAALAEGTPREAVEETLLQIVPYAGFPRALAAFGAAREVLGAAPSPAEERPATSSPEAGRAAFEAVYDASADRVRRGLAALHPLLPSWTIEFAYGRVLSRPVLPILARELLAVSILGALGSCDDALVGHARAAGRLGASDEDLLAAVGAIPSSAGAGRRPAARSVLARCQAPR